MWVLNNTCAIAEFQGNNATDAVMISSPDKRGTLAIFWNCLSIVVLCTWSILVVPVPPQFISSIKRNGNGYGGRSWSFELARTARQSLTKLGYMSFTLLAPEYILARACYDCWQTRDLVKQFKDHLTENGNSWTAAHVRMAEIGGVAVQFDVKDPATIEDESTSSRAHSTEQSVPKDNPCSTGEERRRYKLLDGYISRMQRPRGLLGFLDWHLHPDNEAVVRSLLPHVPLNDLDNLIPLCGDRWYLNASQILIAIKHKIILLPETTEAQVKDKNKSSGLIILLAVIQAAGLTVTLGLRFSAGQFCCLLEFIAGLYAITGIVTYVLQWNCPVDVGTPILVRPVSPRPPLTTDVAQETTRTGSFRLTEEVAAEIAGAGSFRLSADILADYGKCRAYTQPFLRSYKDKAFNFTNFTARREVIWSALLLEMFAGLHVFAPYFVQTWLFPTNLETRIWKYATYVMIGIPFVLALLGNTLRFVLVCRGETQDSSVESSIVKRIIGHCRRLLLLALITAYGLARLVVLGIAVRSLFVWVHPGVFIATDLGEIPSIF